MGLTDRGRATAAAGATLAAAGVLLGFEELTRLGLFALLIVVLAAALVGATRPRVEIEVGGESPTLEAGESASFPLRIRPVSVRTRTLRLDQPLPVTLGGGAAREVMPPLTPSQTFTLDLTLRFLRRGRHELPSATVTREDPFGLASRTWAGGRTRTITVHPRLHPLDIGTVRGTDTGAEGASRRFSTQGDDYGSIRAYRPGDDLRRIHWTVTAHRGELMTRHDERSSAPHLVVALDPRLAAPTAPEVLEWGIELVASLVDAAHRQGLEADLVTASSTGSRVTGDRDEALATLALVPTTPRPPRLHAQVADPFVELLRDVADAAGTLVLVAGTSDPDSTRDLLLTLPPGGRGIVTLVVPADGGTSATALVDVAVQAGWTAVVCDPDTPHAEAWARAQADGVLR